MRSTLSGNTAQGGAGGNSSTGVGSDDGGAGGGGGLGGAGGSDLDDGGSGGGGFGGAGSSEDGENGGGGGGTTTDANGTTTGSLNGGAGGIYQNAGSPGGFGGGGGGGSDEAAGGAGGLGGGGGSTGESDDSNLYVGGAGGFGGGGGAGGEDNDGGNGGFGGGGGGASYEGDLTSNQGGVGGFGGGSGGGILTDSNYGNTGGGGGAGLGGAIFNDGGTLLVTNSTFAGNSALGGAGGTGGPVNGEAGQGLGGGIFARNGVTTLDSSTLSGNAATDGAGTAVANGGALYLLGDGATVYLDGANIQARTGDSTSVTFGIINSILANTPGGSKDAFVNTINSGTTAPGTSGNNLVESNGAGGNGVAGVVAAADPKLGTLQNNGGLTPTLALGKNSPAINTGNTTQTADQRGIVRPSGGGYDIGAFEIANVAPTIVSIVPQGGSDKVGAQRTFTVKANDGNAVGDIREVWLLINTTLDWSAGATLIYRPNAGEPTQGQLFLRQGDAFLPPITIGTGASSSDILDNGAVRVVATDVSVSITGSQIAVTLPLTIRDGLIGRNTLFARVQDTSGAVDPASAPGDLGFIRKGIYAVLPQFYSNQNHAPTLSDLTPKTTNTTLNSQGIAPAPQYLGFFFKDEDGSGDVQEVWFLAGKQRSWASSATFIYYPRTRRLVLRSDDGNSFLGGGRIGTAGIIENSQVKVDLSKVKLLIYNDGKSLGLSLPLQAKTGLLGQNDIWLRVQDTTGATPPDGDELGFVRKGNWNVKANTAGDTKPSNGNS